MRENLILIGMPGAGKSTVGVVLAKTLGMDFLDSDLVICKKTGKTLQEILDNQGLETFLTLEEMVIRDLDFSGTVLATGGSVPLSRPAMEHLKAMGKIVYLQVPLEELKRRLSNIKTRGIAFGPGETLDTLYEFRRPIYEAWADITVNMDPEENNLERTVDSILREIS
jgi:shikimate kinase